MRQIKNTYKELATFLVDDDDDVDEEEEEETEGGGEMKVVDCIKEISDSGSSEDNVLDEFST